MCAVSFNPNVVKTYTIDFMKNNPNLTEDEVVDGVCNYFNDKVSRSGSSKVVSMARSTYSAQQARANFVPVETPVVQMVNNTCNQSSTDRYYYDLSNMSKKARCDKRKRRIADVKAADVVGEKAIIELSKKSEEVVSNNVNKKVANAQYVSSKKRKQAKKQAESNSKKAHEQNRLRNSKSNRDARYLTKNGLMNTEARKLYRAINSHEIIADAPWKSAEESAKVFIENGFSSVPESVTKSSVQNTLQSGLESVTKSSAQNTLQSGLESVTKSSAKSVKGKWGWIAGGLGVALAALGGVAYKNSQEQEQALDISA